MTSATRPRSERIAADVSNRSTSPGAKTGGSGDDTKAAGAKKSTKLKLAVLVLVVLIAGGAIAKFTVLAPSASSKSAAHKVVKPAKGPVIPMQDMTLNLADGHYLRLNVSLQTTKGTSSELDTSEASQLIIDTYSNRSMAELTGTAAREKVKAILLSKLAKAYPKQIMDVYYTDFVMTT